MTQDGVAQHIIDASTSAPATAASVATGWIGYILGNQGEILFFLSATVMIIQIGMQFWRFGVWIKKRKKK